MSLPMFWALVSSNNFHKIIKISNHPLEASQHLNVYLPRQYVANGEDITRDSHGERHTDFSITTFGFCDQPQKKVLHSVKQNRVSGLRQRRRLWLFHEKNKDVSQQCQETFTQPKTSVLNLTKLIGLLSSTVLAV